jgi:hypothetical protein
MKNKKDYIKIITIFNENIEDDMAREKIFKYIKDKYKENLLLMIWGSLGSFDDKFRISFLSDDSRLYDLVFNNIKTNYE